MMVKITKWIAILLMMLVVLVGCGKTDIVKNDTTLSDTVGEIADAVALNEPEVEPADNSNPCPYECCEDSEYDDKECEWDRPCVDNKCKFPDCPYDCCSGYKKYKRQNCDDGYNCEDNDCIAEDDDGDGLLNIEEEDKYETDPYKADTDGDGLTDFEEIKTTKTDPLNENTDGDRYNDKEDPNPMIAVYPDVLIELDNEIIEKNDGNFEVLNLAYTENCEGTVCSTEDIIPITGDLELYTVGFTVERENKGDDYTEYTEFNVMIYAVAGGDKTRIYPTVKERMERLDSGAKDDKEFEFVVKLSDIERGGPAVLVDAALEKSITLFPEIRNIVREGQ